MAYLPAAIGDVAPGGDSGDPHHAGGIYLVYPLEDQAQFSSFPHWWEAICPLMGAPASLVLISLPAVFGLFPKPEPDGV